MQKRLAKLGHQVHDEGNVSVPNPEEEAAAGDRQRLRAVALACQNIYDIGQICVARDEFAVFLGGDHSISIGSVASSTVAAGGRPEPIGLIWIDAHSDFNTLKSSPSGNIHGMPVGVLTGDGAGQLIDVGYPGPKISPANIVQIGIRDGLALERLSHVSRIHVSLDMDSLDPAEAPGVGTPVPGGLTYREAHLLMEILGDSGRICALDIVEINPILDNGNQTAELAVGLAASLLGQRIL
jgi:arginase